MVMHLCKYEKHGLETTGGDCNQTAVFANLIFIAELNKVPYCLEHYLPWALAQTDALAEKNFLTPFSTQQKIKQIIATIGCFDLALIYVPRIYFMIQLHYFSLSWLQHFTPTLPLLPLMSHQGLLSELSFWSEVNNYKRFLLHRM